MCASGARCTWVPVSTVRVFSFFGNILRAFHTRTVERRIFMTFNVEIVIRGVRVNLEVILMRSIIPNRHVYASRGPAVCCQRFPVFAIMCLSSTKGCRHRPSNAIKIQSGPKFYFNDRYFLCKVVFASWDNDVGEYFRVFCLLPFFRRFRTIGSG